MEWKTSQPLVQVRPIRGFQRRREFASLNEIFIASILANPVFIFGSIERSTPTMMKLFPCFLPLAGLLSLSLPLTGQEPTKPLSPADAAKHVNEKVTVELQVKST